MEEKFGDHSKIKTHKFNPKLKMPFQKMNLTEYELSEYIKCKKSILYFCKYIKNWTIDHGVVPYEPWDFQKEILRSFSEERFNIVCSSRQIGKSLMAAVAIIHLMLFTDNQNIIILSNKLATSSEIINKKIKIAYEQLPLFLQHGILTYNINSFMLENGSSVTAKATTPDSIRGISASAVFIDECAFIKESIWNEFFKSSFPTISSGTKSKIIICSTPRGFNHFESLFTKAKLGKNGFVPHEVMWYQVPGRDESWKKREISIVGETEFQQEYCCSFQGMVGSLVDGSVLKKIVDSLRDVDSIDIKDNPTFSELHKYINNIRIFKYPEPGHLYVSSIDSATNTDTTDGDGACLQILDVTELPFEQVAVADFINDTSYLEIPYVQVELARIYNNAVIFNENNCGASRENNRTLVSEIGYENIFWETNKIPGYRTTTLTKSRGCQNLKQLIERGYLKLYDNTTVHQLFQFIKKNNSYEADEGHDDQVMALIGAIFFLQLSQERIEEVFADPDCYYRLPSIVDLLKIIYTTRYEAIEEAVEITADGANFQNKLLNQRQGQSLNALIESGMDDPLTLLRAQERMRSAVTTMRGAEYDQDDDDDFTFLGVDDSAKKRKRTIDDLIF